METGEVEETKEETHTPPPTEEPVRQPEHGESDLHTLVNGLSDRVTHLEGAVTALTPAERDSTPAKRPWTHRRLGGGR